MTEPLSYETPVAPATHPLMAWASLSLALLGFVVTFLALYGVRTTTSLAVGGGGVVIATQPPMWVRVLPFIAIVLPIVGIILGIIAVRKRGFLKSAAIAGITLNGLLLCLVGVLA
jgi:hypothetical protein